MADKKGVNPVLVGVGLAAGAAGALFLSKKENRRKAAQAIKKVGKSSGGWLSKALKTAHELAGDVDALNKQGTLDHTKKKTLKKAGK